MKKKIFMFLMLCGALCISLSCRKDDKTPDLEGKWWLTQSETGTDRYLGYLFDSNDILKLGYYALDEKQATEYGELFKVDVEKGNIVVVNMPASYQITRESETSGTLVLRISGENISARYENLTWDSFDIIPEDEPKGVFQTPESLGFAVTGVVSAQAEK